MDVVDGTDGAPDLLVTLNRTRIPVEGKQALGTFLLGLAFYRSSGDYENGKIFYEGYTNLKGANNETYLLWQKISENRRQPKSL